MALHVIIVGGGAIGLSCAWELAKRGSKVTLVERQLIGRATSLGAAGILPPANLDTATDPLDRLRGLSHQLFPGWAEELQSLTGIDSGLRRCGGWYLAPTAGEMASLVGMTQYWSDLEIQCNRLPLPELLNREPELEHWVQANPQAAAWWVPDEYQIYSKHYVHALQVACEQQGVEFLENLEVIGVDSNDDAATVMTGRGKLLADTVVVSAGVWSGQVSESLKLREAFVPVRGQTIAFECDTRPFGSVINVGNRYLVPRDDGIVIAGSCEEEVGFRLGTTKAALSELREFALDVCPALANSKEIEHWSGLRPMTFDGFPIIGRVPETSNVYVAAGHFRSGMHWSPATGQIVADLVMGEQPAIDTHAFQVARQQSK